MAAAHVVVEAGVIRRGSTSLAQEPGGELLYFTPGGGVDDTGLVFVPGEDRDQLRVKIGAPQNAVGEIRPVERTDENRRILQTQFADDVALHSLGRRGGERVNRDAGQLIAQGPELAVLGSEIMSPLADAMSLVHGDVADADARQQAAKRGTALTDDPLG